MSEVLDTEIVNLPAVRERSSVLLMPVMDVNTALKRLEEFQIFCANYLQESKDGGLDGGDYGAIPGAGKKKVLMKSGADKLCEIYGLYDEYVVISSVENWESGLFDYTLKCVLKSRRDDSMVGSGVGSCSSFESKYRWREAKRSCPKCGKSTIIAGKAEYGGGFICWKKEGRSDGCGAKFQDTDKQITDQIQGRIENPDIIDAKNTVLKMAKKRAKIDATIGVTRSSGIFTQDLDDLPPPPAKPPVEVTDKEIPLGSPTSVSGADQRKGTASASNNGGGETTPAAQINKEPYRVAADLITAVSAAAEYITEGQASQLHIHFKDFLDRGLRKKADSYLESWCKSRGLIDPGGAGSTKFIKATYIRNGAEVSGFTEAKNALEQYALDLNVKMSEAK